MKHKHQKRYPLSAGERLYTEIGIQHSREGDMNWALKLCRSEVIRCGYLRRERQKQLRAGVNPYKRKKAAG